MDTFNSQSSSYKLQVGLKINDFFLGTTLQIS